MNEFTASELKETFVKAYKVWTNLRTEEIAARKVYHAARRAVDKNTHAEFLATQQ